jgi:hypothetical protein
MERVRDPALMECRPNTLCSSIDPFWPTAGKLVAATADFGSLLPPNLSLMEVRHLLAGDGLSPGYVDYANHRGIVTLRVPMSLHVIAEPGAAELMCAALAILTSLSTRRRPRAR